MSLDQDRALVGKVKDFVHARTMQEHWQTYQVFHKNVRWDAPPILLNGREKLRVVAYFAKRICLLDFTEHSIKENSSSSDGKRVTIVCTFNFRPLPKQLFPSLGLGATIELGVTDDLQTVTSIYGRLHSFPTLPNFIRLLNAFILGTVGVVTEQYWSKTLWLYGDRSYQEKTVKQS